MKNYSLCLFMAATFTTAAAQSAPKVTVTPAEERAVSQLPERKASTADVLINESFDMFTAGTNDYPDLDNILASSFSDENIPADLTGGNQWKGHKVYSAGQAIALRTTDPVGTAYIETPRMDYSGSITISFKARYLRVEWTEENEEGEEKTMHWTGSTVWVGLSNDKVSEFNTSEGALQEGYPWLADVRLYENQGWCDVTVEFDNYSAYNDSFVMLCTPDGVVIDDVKITSSVDKFIAPPVVTDVTDVTETGFTVNFEKARKAFNTYVYLLELAGYDDEGNPKYNPIYPPAYIDEVLQSIEENLGMKLTWEEYCEMAGISADSPYSNYGKVELNDPACFTFDSLDPAKDYYIGLRSHYVHTFSDMVVTPVKEIAAPALREAAAINETGFTAEWSPITKADKYEVILYGVNEVREDEEHFIVFNEDFENTAAFTDATSIYEPEWVGYEQDITLDDLTSTPGWTSSEEEWPIVKGMLGTMYWGAWLRTPDIYVGGADEATVSLSLQSDENLPVYMRFADITYELPMTDGRFEEEITLPVNGLDETWLRLLCSDEFAVYIDYLTVTQNLKKGSRTFTYLGTTSTGETTHTFTDLDTKQFDMYAYAVRAIRGEGKNRVESLVNGRMLVDLLNNRSFDRVDSHSIDNITEVARFTIDGQRINAPQKGLNIVRYSDGSVKKIIVK